MAGGYFDKSGLILLTSKRIKKIEDEGLELMMKMDTGLIEEKDFMNQYMELMLATVALNSMLLLIKRNYEQARELIQNFPAYTDIQISHIFFQTIGAWKAEHWEILKRVKAEVAELEELKRKNPKAN